MPILMLPACFACPSLLANAAVTRMPASAKNTSMPMTRDFIVSASLRSIEPWWSCGHFLLPPALAVRKRELGQRLRPDLDAVAGRRRGEIATPDDTNRVDEMLVQVVDELAHPVIERRRDRDVIEHRNVLCVLAEADSARVRTDRHPELRREQDHGQHLVHAAEPAAVELADVDRAKLEQLLEHDAVLHVLPRGDANRSDRLADATVAEDVVGARRLFDPPRIDLRQD